MPAKIALIGCGAIASVIVDAVARGTVPAEVVALLDLYPERCRRLAERLQGAPRVARSIDELLDAGPDIVVEAASQEAVRSYGPRVLERGIDLVVLSVGALLDKATREELLRAAEQTGATIHAPSGAVAGLDAVRAMRHAGIRRVVLRTVKHPSSLGIREEPREPTVIYRGPAGEAVKRYPFNVNVAAALTLAAGVEAEVEIVADPGATRNTHIVVVEGEAGRLEARVENVPSPENPRTSLLAALSAIELLRRLTGADRLQVGT